MLEYFSFLTINFGDWNETAAWLNNPGPSLAVIAGILLILIFFAKHLRGFWGGAVYLIAAGAILYCLNNILRFW